MDTASSPAPYAGRIFLLEDELLVAAHLTELLRRDGYTVCGHAITGPAALKQVLALPEMPDLLVCDVRLAGPWDGIQTIMELRHVQRAPVPVLYLTAYSDHATTARAFDTAPAGYLIKPFTDEQLRVSVAAALHAPMAAPGATRAELNANTLTRRQLDILRLLAEGRSSREIADALHLSVLTVQTHRRNLAQHYGVASTAELMAIALRSGWLQQLVT